MAKLDILKLIIKDLAEDYSADDSTYLRIGEKVITDTLHGNFYVDDMNIGAEQLKAAVFSDCRNDNGFMRCTLHSEDCVIYICRDDDAGVLFIHADSAKNESFVRAVLDNIEILTVYPKNPVLQKYGRENAGRIIGLSIEPAQLLYACDIKAALCYAYAYERESYVLCDGLRVVGIVVLNADGGKGEVEYAAVDMKYQHKGYGNVLIKQALSLLQEKGCKIVTISVHPQNRAALHVYESIGFIRGSEDEGCVRLDIRY